jgi:hypothetical protein
VTLAPRPDRRASFEVDEAAKLRLAAACLP